jgi:nicotinamide mononucleotide transporter
MSWSEILGFVAGALSVWLYVRQSVWAWPTGIANSVFWLILFAGSRLYLDASLQIVYIGLGIVGWVWWVRPRREQRELPVARTLVSQAVALGVIGASPPPGCGG